MKDIERIKYYSPIEEKINIISHAIGFILSIVAFVLLVTHANLHGDVWHIVSFSIFGASLIILYAASTFYHSAKKPFVSEFMSQNLVSITLILKEYAMSVEKDLTPRKNSVSEQKKKRRFLSPEKKFQIFLESQTDKTPVGEILRREGIYSTDLARIRKQVKEAALERLSVRPGPKRKTVPRENYEALKRELEEKERALADQAVELAILRKKTNGGSWER
jgi:transposase-like protein